MTTIPLPALLYRQAIRASALGLAVNLALGAIKLFAGFAGHSFALLTDAVNSLGDSLTSVVVLIGLHIAQRPADAEHPYGHTRAEAIAASNVALLIILSALVLGWEALHRFTGVHDVPPVWTLWIAGSNVLIKEALYRYKRRVAARTGSMALVANAWDHRSDASVFPGGPDRLDPGSLGQAGPELGRRSGRPVCRRRHRVEWNDLVPA